MTATMESRPGVTLPEPVTVTAAQYEAIPPNPRVELVDGVVQVMTPATRLHRIVVQKVRLALEALCPEEWHIVWEQEIKFNELHRRNPDVMAIRAEADDLKKYGFLPEDVLLAIEVVSPGTQTADRLHKPSEYAEHGIEHYWRVETSPRLTVHTYRLSGAGRYVETGVFLQGESVAAPGLAWAALKVDEIAP
ncbi:MAG TPA: Uma2 family endonuclease [Rugosimonospora sp.]|nr:Uma2 family endonuclease [Rugosimonospora sp.]